VIDTRSRQEGRQSPRLEAPSLRAGSRRTLLVEVVPPYTNRGVSFAGRLARLGGSKRVGSGCREEVLVALAALGARHATGGFTRREVFSEMVSGGTGYGEATVFKVLQRMKGDSGRPQDPRLERVGASSSALPPGCPDGGLLPA